MKPIEAIESMVRVASHAQKTSRNALSRTVVIKRDQYLNRSLDMVSAGLEKEFILQTLKRDIHEVKNRHGDTINIVQTMGSYAPMFGMAGTVIGVIQVLKNVTDIDNIVMQNPSTHKNIVMSSNKIPLEDNTIDVIIADWVLEHIENDIEFTSEIDRVLKPGGRFMCLEFSKIDNEMINLIYQKYSKIIPFVGKYIVGSSKPYDYLIKSINEFYSQDELANLIKNNGFSNVEYRNLSNGISAIHSGWKI